MTDDPPVRPPTDDERSATRTFRVRFEEAGPTGSIHASTLLRYAAELAWRHSEARGFGRSWYRERDLAWVVRGVDLRILGRIEDGTAVSGTTRVVAARKVIARRRTEFRSNDGRLAAVIDVDWAMTSSAGVPTRVPAVFQAAFGTPPGTTFTPIRVRPSSPTDPGAPSGSAQANGPPATQAVRRHEVDPMGHVNNAVYLDWAEEAVAAVGGPVDALPRRWRLEYVGAAGRAARVRAIAWSTGTGWSCAVDDPTTGERFLGATFTTDPADLDPPGDGPGPPGDEPHRRPSTGSPSDHA